MDELMEEQFEEMMAEQEREYTRVEGLLVKRGETYGSYFNNALTSQALKEQVRDLTRFNDMPSPHREAVDVILQKISRICNGDSNYEDNWVDIMGYSELVLKEIRK